MDEYLVSLRACPDYEPETVGRAMDLLLHDLGGVASFIQPEQTVLFKPNLLAAEPPERAVTTHPAVVGAVMSAFRPHCREMVVGDSPGIGSCRAAAEKAGIAAAAATAGGRVSRFDRVENFGRGTGRHFPLAVEVGGADLVVNLPKLKTHGMMTLTGAVKNLFGCLVGLRKPGYHLECQGNEEFAALLLELAAIVAPGLTIADAVVGMDGAGPRNGRPRPVGFLLGARDPLALDFVLADLVGLPIEGVPHLKLAKERGLPAADPRRRRVVGLDLESHRIRDFQPPPHQRPNDFAVPGFLLGPLKRSLNAQPLVRRHCRDCGICASVCPARAIEVGQGRARIDRAKCIHCYCCEEMCPHAAIALKLGIIGRLWPWG